METKTSEGKGVRIPGPDHPITISPVEGKVRAIVAGRIVAESTRALRLEEKGYPPVYYLRAAMRICHCWFEPSITPIVRTKAIVRITAFPIGGSKSENAVWAYDKPLTQSPALKSTWRFIPHGSTQSTWSREPGNDRRTGGFRRGSCTTLRSQCLLQKPISIKDCEGLS